jgi:hypothetical protein
MKKLIRSLLVLHLLLAIVALILGVMLFRKREILVGRTVKLETALTALASTIEAESAAETEPPAFPPLDIESVSERLVDHPETSSFWNDYPRHLEQRDHRTINLSNKRSQLAQFYRMDPITLKPMRDPTTREKLTDGSGTMQELLNGVNAKAVDQLNRLGNTRQALKTTREELVDNVNRLNRRKQELRLALHTIVGRDGAIAGLHHVIGDHESTIQIRNETIQQFERDVVDLNGELQRRDDKIAQKEGEIKQLVHKLELASIDKPTPKPKGWVAFSTGLQGAVAGINQEWNFVILKLTPEFLRQYNKMLEMGSNTPEPDLTVVRGDDADSAFVTKIRLSGVNIQDGLGVANILSGWQQQPIKIGDSILY